MFEIVEVVERAAKLADHDASMASNAELLATVTSIERIRSLLDIAEAHQLAVLDQRDVCDAELGLTTKAWLAHTADISARAAGGRVTTATRLRHVPAVDTAVTSGTMSFEHVQALAADANPRVLPLLADVDDQIVELAHQLPFERWRLEVRKLIELLDQDGTEPDETANRLDFADSLDGRTYLRGAMSPDLAAVVRDAIDAKADDLFRRYHRDRHHGVEEPVPPRATLRMLALAELIREGTTGRAEVNLVLHDHQTTDLLGRSLTKAAAGVYGCDPDLWAFLVDDMGVPLDLGHAHRLANAPLRRATFLRDGGCVFPGCDQPSRRCDTHHVIPFPTGPTSLDNLATLCRHHHVVTHRTGWTMQVVGPGRFEWTTPQRRTLANRPPPKPDG